MAPKELERETIIGPGWITSAMLKVPCSYGCAIEIPPPSQPSLAPRWIARFSLAGAQLHLQFISARRSSAAILSLKAFSVRNLLA